MSLERSERDRPTGLHMQRLPRLVELVLAIALCALIAFWITRVLRGEPIPVPPPAVAPAGNGAQGRIDAALASARLFGSRPPGALSDNVRALGVVADATGRGSVIVSIDGQAPKVYRVGDTLDGRLVSAIRPDQIELDANGARQVFRLPPPQPTATGLTVAGSAGMPVVVPPGVPRAPIPTPMERPPGETIDVPPGGTIPQPPAFAPPAPYSPPPPGSTR